MVHMKQTKTTESGQKNVLRPNSSDVGPEWSGTGTWTNTSSCNVNVILTWCKLYIATDVAPLLFPWVNCIVDNN